MTECRYKLARAASKLPSAVPNSSSVSHRSASRRGTRRSGPRNGYLKTLAGSTVAEFFRQIKDWLFALNQSKERGSSMTNRLLILLLALTTSAAWADDEQRVNLHMTVSYVSDQGSEYGSGQMTRQWERTTKGDAIGSLMQTFAFMMDNVEGRITSLNVEMTILGEPLNVSCSKAIEFYSRTDQQILDEVVEVVNAMGKGECGLQPGP